LLVVEVVLVWSMVEALAVLEEAHKQGQGRAQIVLVALVVDKVVGRAPQGQVDLATEASLLD